jgi:hypothetical protein
MPNFDHIDFLIHTRAAQLLGGEAEFRKIADQESKEVMGRWNQDTELIGRILRAHLFLEQFISENLQHANPKLGSIDKAKLGFAQKIDLLDPCDPNITEVTPGIRRLNSIRNRLAHRSKTAVTLEDAAELLRSKNFERLLREQHGEKFATLTPIEVLENFARFASIALSGNSSRLVAAVRQATTELASRDDA